MQIDDMKIPCKEDVHISHTNLMKKMERNLHETTRKQLCKWATSSQS